MVDFVEDYNFLFSKSQIENEWIEFTSKEKVVFLAPKYVALKIFEKYQCMESFNNEIDKNEKITEDLDQIFFEPYSLKEDVFDALNFLCFNNGRPAFLKYISNKNHKQDDILSYLGFTLYKKIKNYMDELMFHHNEPFL